MKDCGLYWYRLHFFWTPCILSEAFPWVCITKISALCRAMAQLVTSTLMWTRNQTVPDDYLHLYKVHVASTMRILILNMEILLKLQCWSSIQGPLCTAFVWNHLSKIGTIGRKYLKKIVKPFCFCKGALLLHCKGTFSFKEPKLLGLWEPRRGWNWEEVEFQRGMLCLPRSPWSDSG